ncbi:MAG: aldo/keto reductase [Geminicoccaceae bacterium]
MLSRRNFLGTGTAAGLGAVVQPAKADASLSIRKHVTLGRTGLKVSEIGFGSASSQDASLIRHALDRCVTFFDTAESYRFGWSEEAMGEGLKSIPRDQIVLNSKTKAGASASETEMMEALEGSLKRLQTDYLDVYFNHAVNSVDRMQNEAWALFTERAKEQGKIRFRGMSGHGSRLAQCLDYAIDNDLVDVILCAFSFGEDPDLVARLKHTFHFVAIQSDLPPVLDKAREKNIGVIAMKTLMGARLNDMRPFEEEGRTYAQAALRWVLSSPRVDAALISMTSFDNIDEYIGASGQADDRAGDAELLGRYASLQSGRYCRQGCNGCEGACPEGVAIAEVLRTRMYDVDYRNPALAVEDYAKLGGSDAAACLTCQHQACVNACPFGIPVPEFTVDAARRLG